ncbi:PA-phosphatase [Roseivirga sp. BDSF3-8]|uniref:PA-phosphatase n=1 Tax=Roseivirga sp. BDSF3-8 TaxID=3241598 RepID=UPI0035321536
MYRRLAWILSVALHPLIMPTLMFVVVLLFAPLATIPFTREIMWQLTLAVFITTFIVPIISISSMKLSRYINSFRMADRQERRLPFLVIGAFYIIATWLFASKNTVNPLLNTGMIAMTTVVVIVAIVTFFWKISVHSAAICGAVGFITALQIIYPHDTLLYPLIIFTLLAGALMSARLYLQSHKPAEVWVGGALGFTVCFLMIYYFGR